MSGIRVMLRRPFPQTQRGRPVGAAPRRRGASISALLTAEEKASLAVRSGANGWHAAPLTAEQRAYRYARQFGHTHDMAYAAAEVIGLLAARGQLRVLEMSPVFRGKRRRRLIHKSNHQRVRQEVLIIDDRLRSTDGVV